MKNLITTRKIRAHIHAEIRHWLNLSTFHQEIIIFGVNSEAEDVVLHQNNLNMLFSD